MHKIAGEALVNREKSEDIILICKIDNINDLILDKKTKWAEHIDRTVEGQIMKITRDKSPSERRSFGRPSERWSDNLPND